MRNCIGHGLDPPARRLGHFISNAHHGIVQGANNPGGNSLGADKKNGDPGNDGGI